MIILGDLKNRVYSGKDCIEFTIDVNDEKDKELFRVYFRRNKKDVKQWNMQVVLERTRDADSQVYNFDYIMPKENLPLALICATGLRYFQMYLKEEIQRKSEYDFTLGEMIRGM